jgi:hypothetical protein
VSDEQPQPETVEVLETNAVQAAKDQAVSVPLASEHDPGGEPSREAAKYRTRLREVETERDALVGRVEALQRAQLEQHITAAGLKPQAVWATGTAVADLVGDDGQPDPAKIKAAVQAARDELGIAARPSPRGTAGLHSGSMGPQQPPNRFVDAFKPSGKR